MQQELFIAAVLMFSQASTIFASSEPAVKPQSIIVVGDRAFRPLHFLQDGHCEGILVDIWRKWSDKTGISVIFECDYNWDEALDKVKSGEAGAVGGIMKRPDREKALAGAARKPSGLKRANDAPAPPTPVPTTACAGGSRTRLLDQDAHLDIACLSPVGEVRRAHQRLAPVHHEAFGVQAHQDVRLDGPRIVVNLRSIPSRIRRQARSASSIS